MAVFAKFGLFCRFCRSCPFCTLLRAPLGTTNSQESLEIIIYIQTASHKNFSMWWLVTKIFQCDDLWVFQNGRFCPFLCVLADLAVLARFVHFLGYHWGQKQPGKSGNYNIYSNGYSQKFFNVMTRFWLIPKPAISCIEKFLCVFVRFGRFSRLCPFWTFSSCTTWDNKQPGKSWNYNIYSNG